MSVRLYVGNLPKEVIDREQLQAMFGEMGEGITTKVIKDRKTGKCRGFAFVTVTTDEMADQFIEKYNGQPFMESPIKIEKALPRSKAKGKEEGEAKDGAPQSEGNATPSAPTKKRNNKKRDRPGTSDRSSSSGDRDAVQPDPRWASELSKLKEMLAAQTTNT